MTTVTSARRPVVPLFEHVRLVWTLAAKDIVDGIRYKSTLTTLVISVLMVGFYRYLPAMMSGGEALTVWVAAETGRASPLVAALERSPALDVRLVGSRARMLDQLSDTETPELGLVIPAAVEADLPSGAPLALDGYAMRWLSAAQRSGIQTLVEEELALLLERPVEVRLAGNEVDLHADGDFFLFSATVSLIFLVVMVGISLIPNLIIEERQARTLDVLLVSPAHPLHVVAGKAVAGTFYGLIGCSVALIAFRVFVVQWPLAILAALVGTLFTAAVGLLLGSVARTRAQLQLLAWFVVTPLLLPVILVFLRGLVPEPAIAVMRYIPTVIVARLYRLSFTVDATVGDYAAQLAATVAVTIALLGLVSWLVLRQDRA